MNTTKNTRAARDAKAVADGIAPTEADVFDAFRESFTKIYKKQYGDTQTAVDAALRFVRDKGCCNFLSLTNAVNTGTLAGLKGGVFNEAAVGAYVLLAKSSQETQSQVAQMPMVEKHKKMEEKSRPVEETETPRILVKGGMPVMPTRSLLPGTPCFLRSCAVFVRSHASILMRIQLK